MQTEKIFLSIKAHHVPGESSRDTVNIRIGHELSDPLTAFDYFAVILFLLDRLRTELEADKSENAGAVRGILGDLIEAIKRMLVFCKDWEPKKADFGKRGDQWN